MFFSRFNYVIIDNNAFWCIKLIKIKSLFVLIVAFLCFSLSAAAEEYSGLFLVKESQKENLESFTTAYLSQNNYKYFKNSAYYVPLKSDNDEQLFHKILIRQNAQNSYFYFVSNSKEDKMPKKLLKQIKKSGLKTKKIRNDELNELFYNDVKAIDYSNYLAKLNNDVYTKYDFSDEAQARFDLKENKYSGLYSNRKNELISENKNIKDNWQENIFTPPPDIKNTPNSEIGLDNQVPFSGLRGQVVHIPKGHTITATLQSSIDSQSITQDDVITATLSQDWYYNSTLIAPAGSILYGHVVRAKKAGYAHGNGEIEITFNELLTVDGQKFNLAANSVKLTSGVNRSVKIASRVITGAILGVASGALYAIISGGDISRGLAWGAGAGGVGGLVNSGLQKGQNIEVPSGAHLQIKFTEAMNVATYY